MNKLRVQARSLLCSRIRYATDACGARTPDFWTARHKAARRRFFLAVKTLALIEYDRTLQEGEN